MNYEMINGQLGIASCRIADITGKQAAAMLKQFGDSPLSSITMFYEPEDDIVVLNRDHKGYELYRKFVEGYLSTDEAIRLKVREKDSSEPMKEIITVLDEVISRRHVQREFFILGEQIMFEKYDMPGGLMKKIIESYPKSSPQFWMWKAFTYGIIQGKRMERARRKAAQHDKD